VIALGIVGANTNNVRLARSMPACKQFLHPSLSYGALRACVLLPLQNFLLSSPQAAQNAVIALGIVGRGPNNTRLARGMPACKQFLHTALLHVASRACALLPLQPVLLSSPQAAHNAVIALGIVGAGTNNARLAGILRNLASYYYKEPSLLFLVRTAQGITHMGKGLIGLTPYHTDKQLLSGEPPGRVFVCWQPARLGEVLLLSGCGLECLAQTNSCCQMRGQARCICLCWQRARLGEERPTAGCIWMWPRVWVLAAVLPVHPVVGAASCIDSCTTGRPCCAASYIGSCTTA
jgi:hypothetical protein